MELDIDSGIFIGFLVANLLLGLSSSRGVTSIKEYAVGTEISAQQLSLLP